MYKLLVSVLEWFYKDSMTAPDFRPRDRPMEILALGISRSGTDSLKQALEQIGYERTYHGFDPMIWPEEMMFWREAIKAKFHGGKKFTIDDWDRMFGHCRAISDIPAILFAKELLEAYPNAKVILSTRDIDSWHKSVMNSVQAQVTNYPQRFCQLFHPKMFHFVIFYEAWNLFFHGDFENRGKYVYEEYNAMIRGLVPKERLLEYHVSEGWEPLCEWLGKEVPEIEMPNGNLGTEFAAKCARIQAGWFREMKWNMLKVFGGSVAFGAVAAALALNRS